MDLEIRPIEPCDKAGLAAAVDLRPRVAD